MGEDIIFIESLTASTILGVHEEERKAPRQVVVSVRLRTDIRKAARSDAIEDCVDYSRLAAGIHALLDGARFFTVEALAEEIWGGSLCRQWRHHAESQTTPRTDASCQQAGRTPTG